VLVCATKRLTDGGKSHLGQSSDDPRAAALDWRKQTRLDAISHD
jgi:hypothetical protein